VRARVRACSFVCALVRARVLLCVRVLSGKRDLTREREKREIRERALPPSMRGLCLSRANARASSCKCISLFINESERGLGLYRAQARIEQSSIESLARAHTYLVSLSLSLSLTILGLSPFLLLIHARALATHARAHAHALAHLVRVFSFMRGLSLLRANARAITFRSS